MSQQSIARGVFRQYDTTELFNRIWHVRYIIIHLHIYIYVHTRIYLYTPIVHDLESHWWLLLPSSVLIHRQTF